MLIRFSSSYDVSDRFTSRATYVDKHVTISVFLGQQQGVGRSYNVRPRVMVCEGVQLLKWCVWPEEATLDAVRTKSFTSVVLTFPNMCKGRPT
jgi:hypothetical protein